MSSLDIPPTTQPAKHDQRPSLSLQARQTTKLEVSQNTNSSRSEIQDSAPPAEFHIPDTQAGCADMILEQKGRIIRREEHIEHWKKKHRAMEQHAKEAREAYEDNLARKHTKVSKLALQNATLVRAAAEADSKLKQRQEELEQEQEKVPKLRLEYDCLQQDLSQQRVSADEDDRIARRTQDNLNGLVQSFVENTIRDFNADVDQALLHFRKGGDAFVRNSNRHLREDQAFRSNVHRGDSQKRPRESPNNTAEVHLPRHVVAGPLPPDSPTASRGRKRSPNKTNKQPRKRFRSEVEDYGSLHDQGEEQRTGNGRSASIPGISSVGRTQHTTLGPRPPAVTRLHSTKAPVLPVAQTTLRSI